MTGVLRTVQADTYHSAHTNSHLLPFGGESSIIHSSILAEAVRYGGSLPPFYDLSGYQLTSLEIASRMMRKYLNSVADRLDRHRLINFCIAVPWNVIILPRHK